MPQLYQQIEPGDHALLNGQPGLSRPPDIPANKAAPRQISLFDPLQYSPGGVRFAVLCHPVAAPGVGFEIDGPGQRPQGCGEAHRAAVPIRQVKDQGEGRHELSILGLVSPTGTMEPERDRHNGASLALTDVSTFRGPSLIAPVIADG